MNPGMPGQVVPLRDDSGIPNLREAERFLALLGDNLNDWTFQTFDDNSDRRDGALAQILHAHDGRVADRLAQLNGQGAGVFAMINRGDGSGRKTQNVIGVRAVFVDLDGAPLIGIEAAPLEPHLVVESSPGRYHAYWRIEGLALDHFETVQSELARRFGGDPSVKDLPRVMRLPGFYHRKADPFRTRILQTAAFQPYDAADLLKRFEIDPTSRLPDVSKTGDGRKIEKGGRNSHLASLAGSMRSRGMSQAAIEVALQEENRSRCEPPLSAVEVTGIARSIGRYAPVTGPVGPARSQSILRCVADIAPTPIEWLWPGRFALGKVTLIVGDPGLGKSLLTLDLVAHVTRGQSWPVDHTPCPMGDVLLLTAEDDVADTIRPRLDAAGANPSRVQVLEAIFEENFDGRTVRRMPNLASDVERLDEILARGTFRLVIIDPVSAYLGGVDTHRNADLRSVLAPLADLAARHKTAIVCVSHLNKGAGASVIYRTSGSIAFVAAARAAYVVARDPQDDARRLVLPIKNNLAEDRSGLAYRIRETEGGVPALVWDAERVTQSADQVLAPAMGNTERTEREEGKEWLKDFLAEGPVGANEVKRAALAAGFSWKTIQRAKDEIGAIADKTDFRGGWQWSLPKVAIVTEGGHGPDVTILEGVGDLHADDQGNASTDDLRPAATIEPKTTEPSSGTASEVPHMQSITHEGNDHA